MASTPQGSPHRHPAVHAIRQLTRSWIQKDAEAMARQLTEDITELGSTFATPLTGKRQFFRKYHSYLTGSLSIERYSMRQLRLVPLSSRLVLVYFSYRMRTRTQRGEVEESTGQESMLVRKSGKAWKVQFIHWHRM